MYIGQKRTLHPRPFATNTVEEAIALSCTKITRKLVWHWSIDFVFLPCYTPATLYIYIYNGIIYTTSVNYFYEAGYFQAPQPNHIIRIYIYPYTVSGCITKYFVIYATDHPRNSWTHPTSHHFYNPSNAQL